MIDFSDIEEKYKVERENEFQNIIFVDNIPVVNEQKVEKLKKLLTKLFKTDDIHLTFKGFCFIRFKTAEEATEALGMNQYKLDKSHTFQVKRFEELDKLLPIENTDLGEFQKKDHLKYFLKDERARDQFAIIKQDEVQIFYNNKQDLPSLIQARHKWSDSKIKWSPHGTFLTTMHLQGIALWGGPNWEKQMRFAHDNVQLIHFSPNEKYCVTVSTVPFITDDGLKHNICVWDLVLGTLLRSFPLDDAVITGEDDESDCPLKWSFDGQYVAKMKAGSQGSIMVFELPSMNLVDKKSIKIDNLLGFQWSPKNNMISFHTPEIDNVPARVTLMSIPNRDIVRTKNFFNISKCEIYWAQSGDYLIVKLERQKTKTVSVMSLEIFRIREKDVPVDVIEMKPSEEITGLFFEPKGNRFVLFVQFEMSTFTRFFEVEKKIPGAIAGVKLLKELDTKGLDYCSWAPEGRFLVLCGFRSTGELQFWDIKDLTLFSSQEHYGVKQIYWDPTGRYVTTTNTSWKTQNDTGLIMWNLAGSELNKQSITGFKQFSWRPRPPSILDEKMQVKIKKNLKTYSKEFDMEDSMESNKASQDVVDKRREMWKEYNEMLKKFALKAKEEEKDRIKLYGFDPLSQVVESLEETEEVIEESEEVVAE